MTHPLLTKLERALTDTSGVYVGAGVDAKAYFSSLASDILAHICMPFPVSATAMPPGFPDAALGSAISGHCVAHRVAPPMLKQIALAIAAYIPCWVAAHCAVMLARRDGPSLDYLVSYFKLAWSFSAGELPSFIWLVSLALYATLLIGWFMASRPRRRSGAV